MPFTPQSELQRLEDSLAVSRGNVRSKRGFGGIADSLRSRRQNRRLEESLAENADISRAERQSLLQSLQEGGLQGPPEPGQVGAPRLSFQTPELQDFQLKDALAQRTAKQSQQDELAKIQARNQGFRGNQAPSNVRSFEFFEGLSPEQQTKFMQLQRANPALNLGDETVIPNPADPSGAPLATFEQGLTPAQQPENIVAATEAKERTEAEIIREFQAPKVRAQLDGTIETTQNMIAAIDEILAHPGLSRATGLSGSIDPRNLIPGTQGVDAERLIDSLKNRIFIDTLQTMRANSPTGGAVGNVSDAEGARMENAQAALALTQSDEQFREQLQKIRQIATDSISRLNGAFDDQFGTSDETEEEEIARLERELGIAN